MEDWKELQRQAYQNKVDHGFNVTDVPMEFSLLYGEVGEAYQAWSRQKPDVGEELADVAIYLLGLAEILDVDLGQEVRRKMDYAELNLKENSPSVDEAMAILEINIDICKKSGVKVLKVIHGYGSHGVGGAICLELRNRLRHLKK